MLSTIIAIYRVTDSILGTVVIFATIGVRQVSPHILSTVCFLCERFYQAYHKKKSCAPDEFLSWLNLLAIMDDTVLLATSRAMLRKLEVLKLFCTNYRMKINQSIDYTIP